MTKNKCKNKSSTFFENNNKIKYEDKDLFIHTNELNL